MLVKFQPKPDVDAFILAMMLMYYRAPSRKTAPGEVVDLGEVGQVREVRVRRMTPYSIAETQEER